MSGVLNALFMMQPQAAAGSISFVGAGTALSEGAPVSVPISGGKAGDTVFVWVLSVRSGESGPPSTAEVSGYTQVGSGTTDRISTGQLFYKRLTAADTSVTVRTGYGSHLAAVTYTMRGVAASPIGAAAWSTGNSLYVHPDPPSVTPTVSGSAVLAVGGVSPDHVLVTITSGPTGFSNPTLYSPSMNEPFVRVGAAWTPWTTGDVNPSAFALRYSNNNQGSIAGSIVLLPG